MEKLEGPVTRLTFLGFELDIVLLEVCLLVDKLSALQALVLSWLGRKSCTWKELELLVGHLGQACRVVPPGKTFLRRMYELLFIPTHAHDFVRLNAGQTCGGGIPLWPPLMVPLCHTLCLLSAIYFRCLWWYWLWSNLASDVCFLFGLGLIFT